MTKEHSKRLRESIQNLIVDPDKENERGNLWDRGYNTACKQILEMIEILERAEQQ